MLLTEKLQEVVQCGPWPLRRERVRVDKVQQGMNRFAGQLLRERDTILLLPFATA
jgi:hypothetical protein